MENINSKTAEEHFLQFKDFLHYDKDTGYFTWIKEIGGKSRIGNIAGTKEKVGYIRIRLRGKSTRGHQLAFLFEKGYIPPMIDHLNEIKDDNRFCNLREVNKSQNQQNQAKAQSNSSTGIRGVSWDKSRQKYKACLCINGETILNARFDNLEDAIEARRQAELKYFTHAPINRAA